MISKNKIKEIKSLETKKGRTLSGLFVAEGPKVVGDLLRRGDAAEIYATREWMESNSRYEATEITADELRKASFLQHPQQVIALFPLPDISTKTDIIDTDSLSIALDGVQDPGNLGTIIRLADWFDIDTIVCSRDTADAWNPKVVQATMGSIARVRIVYTELRQLLETILTANPSYPIYGTLLDGNNIYDENLSHNGIIVMGNEGNGISQEIRSLVNHRLLIPTFRRGDSAESLNVAIATAITCSEFRRRNN
jgi:TrmH family RNA methyltransferase